MMNFIEKVGNIRVFTEKNADRDITVTFINGSDIVMREVYFTNNETAAIADLFRKMDTYTLDWMLVNILATELVKMSENTYRFSEKDYFCRIDDTRYFMHFCKSADEFIADKNGMRIIDR